MIAIAIIKTPEEATLLIYVNILIQYIKPAT